MPTGYTAKLCKEEQSFSEFALGCARAMGACVMQRDDPIDDLPKVRERDTYHDRELAVAKANLQRLTDLSETERLSLGTKKRLAQIKLYREQIAERTIIHNRIQKMIDKVSEWMPPTTEHVGLKVFMLEQLTTTLKHDGDVSYYQERMTEEQTKNSMDYYNAEVQSVQWNIDYHVKESAKLEERVTDQSQWITALYESLGKADPEMTALLLKRV